MPSSAAASVAEYLQRLPDETRSELEAVRKAIKRHLPKGYVETMQYGMISYVVPLERYPAGYLGKPDVPLPFISLGAQKRHLAAYLMCLYGDAEGERAFRAAWANTGKKLDLGKSCLRFQSASDLALEVLGRAIACVPVDDYVARHESARGSTRKPKRAASAKRAAPTAAATGAGERATPAKRAASAKRAAPGKRAERQ